MAALVKREVIKMLILKNIPTYTMAAFGNLCLKSIWDKSQFYAPTSKKSKKNKALVLCEL